MKLPDSNGGTPIHFLFPGHGSERIHMARGLYEQIESFRKEVDRCMKIVDNFSEFDLKPVLFPSPSVEEQATRQISQTIFAQPALFTVEYSLAKLLGRMGIKPDGMLGHSVSEYVAACLAGVFSLDTALEIVTRRGQLVQKMPSGSMLAVTLTEEQVQPYLNERLDLGSTIRQQVIWSFFSKTCNTWNRWGSP